MKETNNCRVILISFADTRYQVALDRLKKYTDSFPFDERYFLTEKDLPKDYLRKIKPWLYRRGFGYWSWKPYIVRRQLEQMSDGDILFYSDCGIYWNGKPKALERFNDYLQKLMVECDILTFEEAYPEECYTKGDVISLLKSEKSLGDNQLWDGCFAVKKTTGVMSFISRFEELCSLDLELVTDKRSKLANAEGFVEHRHDQSIFSCLVKQTDHITIPNSEVNRELAEQGLLEDYPIQARHMKELGRPWHVVLKNKLLRPWRMILNYYFRYIRDYHFAGNAYPW